MPALFTRRTLLLGALVAPVVAACSSDKGIDIGAMIDGVLAPELRVNAADLGIETTDADAFWKSTRTVTDLADATVAQAKPDERTDDAESVSTFLLYPAGTVWFTPLAAGGTGVLLYRDNDKAYRRHNRFLGPSLFWGSRLGGYRSAGVSNGRVFRGGGSGVGK